MPAHAALTASALADVGVSPPDGAGLPAGLFVDQSGRAVRLGPSAVPTILLFADYTCAHLCGPGVTLTAGALHDAGLRTPADYRLVVIGLDQDGPARARAFAKAHLHGLDDARRHALLLTATPTMVAAAERALGYHAVYDPQADQFAHDAASFVFTPAGRLSRVLPETAATPAMLRDALRAARDGALLKPTREGFVARIVAVCYGLGAAYGLYGPAIVIALRVGGVATLVALMLLPWGLSRRRRRAS